MIRLRAGKLQRNGGVPGGSSETTRPFSRMCSCRRRWRRGYGDVGTARQHRESRPSPLEAAAVGGGVDAQRKPAHHRHARRSEAPAEGAGHLGAVGARVACADDGHRRLAAQELEGLMAPRREQGRGRVVEVAQPTWILGRRDGRAPGPGLAQAARAPRPASKLSRSSAICSARSPATAASRSDSERASRPEVRRPGRSSRPAMRGASRPTRNARRRQASHADHLHAAHAAISPAPPRRYDSASSRSPGCTWS